ncbi:hypothetical protein K2V52_14000 [Staphylococcus nepalensis]|uniref:hypothetical protein n=1 Tax=Staphylococcus nepalensis TaxID=214473 RepID=UPI001E58E427|nr:hypothetical protein [Staphylococcus nepalensis]MCD8893043.1 hypothetical protein [Staphylococcus nepalensis]
MKAAVMENQNNIPEIGTFPEPQNTNELVKVNVLTVALEIVIQTIYNRLNFI